MMYNDIEGNDVWLYKIQALFVLAKQLELTRLNSLTLSKALDMYIFFERTW
jgi:hypothetical protein